MHQSLLSVAGYDLLGDGNDGLRISWRYRDRTPYVESAAFIQRSKGSTDGVCGYTASVSAGCILRTFRAQCAFCRTGNVLPFSGPLSFMDIAKQNIFMVLADMNCNERPELKNRPREFAYMGQGEPGFAYQQVRQAIELTNQVMGELGQTVYRHIFSTCGIPEAIRAYRDDIEHFFTKRVTLHISLHAGADRDRLMPINSVYPYREVLAEAADLASITGEKPCVGVLLFNNFKRHKDRSTFSTTLDDVASILSELDPGKYRLSFCEYNPSADFSSADPYPEERGKEILDYARRQGFEAKLFSSYGREKQSACGMLAGKAPDFEASKKWRELEDEADALILKNR